MTEEEKATEAFDKAVELQDDLLEFISTKDVSVASAIMALGMAYATACANYKANKEQSLTMVADMLMQATDTVSSATAH